MIAFARTDTSILGQWWWTVDRWTLAVLALLMGIGLILVLAASPAVADRHGLDSFHFARRQAVFLGPSLILMFAVSLLSPRGVRRLAVIGFALAALLTVATLLAGAEIKGAKRWIDLAGHPFQPSEFLKPTFAVVAAWMLAASRLREDIPGNRMAIALFALVLGLLVLQPDIGMAAVVSAVWFTQFFLAGLPLFWAAAFVAAGITGMVAAYALLPHVADRVDRFFDPAASDNYQIARALESFMNGGLFGRGPGEGTVKGGLPDAHTDFIFAVAGEEFGLVLCLVIVGLFTFVVVRGFSRLLQEENLFVMLAGTGLAVQFGLQAVINMASTLHLMPTKGMTLPFISYGGSSSLSLALGMGMLLALTRRRAGEPAW